ncbi:MAG: SUMF1/EgtB/PvdO family nonheme iron enzyme [Alphaproteobacteria bacterium]|nr:SUMF1/EgtB/PvdO family nonheme iron enzyme [Alphaproteobacteria bacterium]
MPAMPAISPRHRLIPALLLALACPGVAGPDVPPGMVRVPGGVFVPGAPVEAANRASVTVPPFALDPLEVTAGDFARCVDAGGCPDLQSAAEGTEACNLGRADRADHPMNCVSHDEAAAYCAWAGKRLPHEYEWAWAARGPDDDPYPWGAAPATCDRAWVYLGDDSCGTHTTRPVGQARAGRSPFGIEGMGGNVAEWVRAADGGDAAVVRGGSYASAPEYGIVWNRTEGFGREPSVGFRCAADLQAGAAPFITAIPSAETTFDAALTGDALSQVLPHIGPPPPVVALQRVGEPVPLARAKGRPEALRLVGFGQRLLATGPGLYAVDPATGAVEELAAEVDAVAVSGERLAVASGGVVRILDGALKPVAELRPADFVGPEGTIPSVSLSRDGRRVALVAAREGWGVGPAAVFDVDTGEELGTLNRIDNAAVALNADGSVLFTDIGYAQGEGDCYAEVALPSDEGRGGFTFLDDDHVVALFQDREAGGALDWDAWVLPRPPMDAGRPMPARHLDWSARRPDGGLGPPVALDPRTSWLAAQTPEGLRVLHLKSRHVVATLPALQSVQSLAFLKGPPRLVALADGALHVFDLSEVAAPDVPDFHFTRYRCPDLLHLQER